MSKGEDIQDRLVEFAVGIIEICMKLPKDAVGEHITGQMLRSGTSPAANYAEARGAESRRDFIHKLRIGLKELNETLVWLSILRKSRISDSKQIDSLSAECKELSKILGASIQTAKRNKKDF